MHISVMSILLTYLNAVCLLVVCTCVKILQVDIESWVQQCVTHFCRVIVNAVYDAVYSATSCLQWGAAMLITSRLSGVSYEWLTVSKPSDEK